MCGRFTLTVHHIGDVAESVRATLADQDAERHRPRYNAAPGQDHWLLRAGAEGRSLVWGHWGLLNAWDQDRRRAYKQINARIETLSERPAYREAFRQSRCLIPVDGFFEWDGPKNARRPIWFRTEKRSVLWMAGLTTRFADHKTGDVMDTFAVVTRPANGPVAAIHDRMPLFVGAKEHDLWLTGSTDPRPTLMKAALPPMIAQPASVRLNRVDVDDESVLVAEPQRQLDLFSVG